MIFSAIVAGALMGSVLLMGQTASNDGEHSLQAPQDPREPAVLAQCQNPPSATQGRGPGPAGPGRQGPPPPGVREYTVTEIPGVIASGQQWKFLWQAMGNNGDGIVGTSDGGVLIAQNDNSKVVKLDKDGRASVVHTNTNTGGALSMNAKGALFIVERGLNPSVVQLAPQYKVVADRYLGDPLDCIGAVINDLAADSKGGVYFTMGGLFHVSPRGEVTKYGENLRTNGVVLSPSEKTLYVTNGTSLAAFDVRTDGSLVNQREFAHLDGGGFGDGSAVDQDGRIYVATSAGVQVIGPDGKYLGLIPAPRRAISVAFGGGKEKNTLFILARGATDANGEEVANAAQVYAIQSIAKGYKGRAK